MAQFAEPVVSFLLESISKLLIEEGKHLLGVSDKAQQLQSELKLMLSLVKSADQRQDEDPTLKEWIYQSKDLAYKAENVLETIAFRTASRNFLKRSICVFNECYVQHNVGSEIEALNDKISNLSRRFHEFGIRGILEKEGPSSRQQQLIRRTYSHVEDEDFVGLEDNVKILAEALVKEEYKVISICGMGGLGKTTVARKVYNHPNIRRHFGHFAWVCISQQWQTREILVSILLKLIPAEKKNDIERCENVDILVQELHQVQQDEKCLIVLDDIWSSSAWDCMKNAFPTRGNGSKVLLTTRNKDVAIHIGGANGFHQDLRLLTKDESWDLLQKKALKGRNFHVHGDIQKFEELGKEMVEYCRGLPLAVVVLGGILVNKHDFDEWEVVSKNVKSYLEKGEIIGEEVGEVQRILVLSYNDLPYQLKPCFLYMGIYPEDDEIVAERLYQLWMAEGMVSEADRIGEESMMDTAERYLGELAKRSMVQVTVKGSPGIRKFRSCRLHDLMRDLCLRKGGEENFLKVIDYRSRDHTKSVNSRASNSSMAMIQRLVIFLNSDDVSSYHHPKKESLKHVRSFTFSLIRGAYCSSHLSKTRFKNFKMLRALTMEKVIPSFEEKIDVDFICSLLRTADFPVGNLIHLRCLSLTNSVYLTLPTSICKLQHLETLDLTNTTVLWMKDIVHRLRNLRYLYLPDDEVSLGKLHLVGLNKLEILKEFSAKTCHLMDLCKLTNLQVLSANIHIDSGVEVMRCISNLPQLKEARLMISEFDASQGFELLFCSNLRHLTLSFIIGKLNKLPKYQTDFLKNLTELRLHNAQLQIDPMETLEKLPKLQRLWMDRESFVGEEMTCHAMGFPQLTFLSIFSLEYLETWTVEEGAMPNLCHLIISDSGKLKMIPDGLRFIVTLGELVIEKMPLEFGERVSQEGEDFVKVCNVASIVVR